MPIVEEYISLTAKWKAEYGENTVVLMQVGKFLKCMDLWIYTAPSQVAISKIFPINAIYLLQKKANKLKENK